MSSMYHSFVIVSCWAALFCSLVHGQTVMVETYFWRTTSVSRLASLGYSEIVGTLHPTVTATHTPPAVTATVNRTSWVSIPRITSTSLADSNPDVGCTIFIGPSVQVYHFPGKTKPTNTWCFTGGSSQTPTALPPGYTNFVSPSVYIIVPAISAGNAHSQIGGIYSSVTFSLAAGHLSTIEGQNAATKVYNFADLPCPPSDVASKDSWFYQPTYNPTRAYEPRILIPATVTNLDPAWKTCTATAQYQGFDPLTALPTVDAPGDPGLSRRLRRAPAIPLEQPVLTAMPDLHPASQVALPNVTPTSASTTPSVECA